MRTRAGFTIFEIAFVTLISAGIMLSLYTVFQQVMRSRTGIMARVGYITSIPLAYQQIKRDITGTYVPEPAIADMFRGKQEQVQKLSAQDAFALVQSDDNMSLFSGITVNPLLYENTPQRARYLYRLSFQEGDQAYTLYRYQTYNVAESPDRVQEQQEGFAVLSNIKEMKVRLFVPEKEHNEESQQKQEQQGQNQKGNQKKRQPVPYQELQEWQQVAEGEEPEYLIPAYLAIDLKIYVDEPDTTEDTFDDQYIFPIPAYAGIHHTYQAYAEQQTQASKKQGQQGLQGQQGQMQQQSGQNPARQQSGGQQQPARQQAQTQQTGQQVTRRIVQFDGAQPVLVTSQEDMYGA